MYIHSDVHINVLADLIINVKILHANYITLYYIILLQITVTT